MTYQIASAETEEELEYRVAELIAQGYRPQGGVALSITAFERDTDSPPQVNFENEEPESGMVGSIFAQAMVKDAQIDVDLYDEQ